MAQPKPYLAASGDVQTPMGRAWAAETLSSVRVRMGGGRLACGVWEDITGCLWQPHVAKAHAVFARSCRSVLGGDLWADSTERS